MWPTTFLLYEKVKRNFRNRKHGIKYILNHWQKSVALVVPVFSHEKSRLYTVIFEVTLFVLNIHHYFAGVGISTVLSEGLFV
jgi:hypothetical protein